MGHLASKNEIGPRRIASSCLSIQHFDTRVALLDGFWTSLSLASPLTRSRTLINLCHA